MAEREGVIKFSLRHESSTAPLALPGRFNAWRGMCLRLGLIGQDAARYQGLGFGNLSIRSAAGFIVSGTQTGHLPQLSGRDVAEVTGWDIAANTLDSRGPCRPSSEAMTHAAIYGALAPAAAVIHVHAPRLWLRRGELDIPETAATVAYGTPDMALALADFAGKTTSGGVVAMAGHDDGLIAWGQTLDEAGQRLLSLWLDECSLHADEILMEE